LKDGPDWLEANGRQTEGNAYQQKSQALWSQLSAAFPDNAFLRNRAQGVRTPGFSQHQSA
jgi:hypothetical protein